jgi:hypothetical protein
MKDIEKNDVDISKLFKWGTSTTVQTPRGDAIVWMKILGDADVNKARIYALRRSAEMRAKMVDLDSDERIALLPPLDTTNKNKAVEVLLTILIKEITDVALKDVDIKYPVDPTSDASLEELEKHQAVVDNFPNYVSEMHRKAIEKETAKERKRLKKMSLANLEELYTETMVNHVCENEMYRAFQDRSVWLACYQDENFIMPLFAEFNDFINLPTEVKTQLIDFYATLSIDIDTLKK